VSGKKRFVSFPRDVTWFDVPQAKRIVLDVVRGDVFCRQCATIVPAIADPLLVGARDLSLARIKRDAAVVVPSRFAPNSRCDRERFAKAGLPNIMIGSRRRFLM